MPLAGAWCKVWIYLGFVFAWTKGARPRFDTSTDMGLVLVPADAEVDSVIFRLRATDQDADFPLVFEITATITPVVRIDNLPCTLYNKVCQANVILTKRLIPGRLHDFAVRVRDTKGDSNSMQATISVTNATTPRDKIFPHIPSLIMVPEDTKPGKELDYLLARANSWSGKPVYIELWQPKELFTIRQRQTPTQTRGIITLIGELDFETQSMYTLTMYATDPYTEPGKDTRNIAGLNLVVVVQDVQDVPPIFTLAPPLTRINNSVQIGDMILRVHAEDGDKGVPREIVYGLVSESNPFTPFFNISESTGEIILAKPLEELTQITHVGAPVVLTVVAEEIRRSREEPPAQATVVDVGFLLGEPGNSPPYFESDNYAAVIDENLEPGTIISFGEQYSTKVRDEDIGKAGVFALKLENNNGTFEINPSVAERTADFVITVRDNTLIDYEMYKSLSFKIIAQEVGPATNLSASVPVIITLRDINDNPPVFDEESYEVTLSENVTAGTRVVQVHATDKDTGDLGSIRYTSITGEGSEAFTVDPDMGLITVSMGSSLDREVAPRLLLSVEARDENGNGNKGVVPLIVNLLDVNDNAPLFEKEVYEFILNSDLSNFTTSAVIKAIDTDAEPPNNEVRYELIHGNYENKFNLNEITGELFLRSPITKIRRKKQSSYEKFAKKGGKEFVQNTDTTKVENEPTGVKSLKTDGNQTDSMQENKEVTKGRRRRENDDALYTLSARAYDLGVPHLSSVTQIRILSGVAMEARIVMFVVPGEHPDSTKTAETLAAITGGRVTVLETRAYVQQNQTTSSLPGSGKKSIVVARVEQTEPGTPLVDVEKIRETLAANGVGIIGGTDMVTETVIINSDTKPVTGEQTVNNDGKTTNINNTITTIHEEVTVYKAENKLLFWLLIILGLLMLLAIAALIICCICPGCPFYMAPRKRRVHSSETLVIRSDGRPKRHLHRKPAAVVDAMWNGRKQAWSADPTRRNWQFNRRNTKNCGQSSLPGDVAYISGQQNDVQVNIESLRPRNSHEYDPSRRSRIDDQERMYLEDVEGQKVRSYEAAELDSLQRHEMERNSDVPRQSYRQRYIEPEINEETAVREQHFYREGNAEVLRLVTRGQIDDSTMSRHHHHPTTLIVDGKDIILKRFIEDQKSRHDLSMQDLEGARSMESHQRSKEVCQQQQPEIIIIPDRLDLAQRQHVDELGPNVQRLVIDHGDYESQKIEGKESQVKDSHKPERHETVLVGATVSERPSVVVKEHIQTNAQSYSYHDLELARQNALLTRLLLERENRHVGGGVIDSTSYLETQSLPGQVAIATQTDRTTATQTERHVRSRSDNDESDEDSRYRKKLKSKKKYGSGDWKKTRTLWMKSPIEEEVSPCFDKRLSILRKKVREVKEGRKITLEPDVLREISDSLDGNGSSYRGEEEESVKRYKKSTERSSITYRILNEEENGSPSSEEICRDKYERVFGEKTHDGVIDDHKVDATESTSSPERKAEREKYSREKKDEKSPKKDTKSRKKDGIVKPSFRILEREITLLTKKLSKLGDKKPQESAGSDSTSHEKSASTSKDSKKESDPNSSMKVDVSSSRGQKQPAGSSTSTSKTEHAAKQRKEAAVAKTRQKLKYQQAHVMSTGSSEYDDAFDKPRKQSSGTTQKPVISIHGHPKLKRQLPVDRRELKKQIMQLHDQDIAKRKDISSKEASTSESKFDKSEKTARTPKLVAIPRVEHVSQDLSTSTSSERLEGRTTTFDPIESNKRSNSESSENGSNSSDHRDGQAIAEQVSEKVSDYLDEPLKKEDVERQMVAQAKVQDAKEELKAAVEDTIVNNRLKVVERKSEDKQVGEASKGGHQNAMKEFMEESTVLYAITKPLVLREEDSVTTEVEESNLTKSNSDEGKKGDEEESVTESGKHEEVEELTADNKSDMEKEKTETLKGDEQEDKPQTGTEETVKQVGQDKFEKFLEKDELLRNTKNEIDKIDYSIQKHEEESESMRDRKEDLEEEMTEASEKNERNGLPSSGVEKEADGKKFEESQRIKKRDSQCSDIRPGTGKSETQESENVLSDNKTDFTQEAEESRKSTEIELGDDGKEIMADKIASALQEDELTEAIKEDIKGITSPVLQEVRDIIDDDVPSHISDSKDQNAEGDVEIPDSDTSSIHKKDMSPKKFKIEDDHIRTEEKESPQTAPADDHIHEEKTVSPKAGTSDDDVAKDKIISPKAPSLDDGIKKEGEVSPETFTKGKVSPIATTPDDHVGREEQVSPKTAAPDDHIREEKTVSPKAGTSDDDVAKDKIISPKTFLLDDHIQKEEEVSPEAFIKGKVSPKSASPDDPVSRKEHVSPKTASPDDRIRDEDIVSPKAATPDDDVAKDKIISAKTSSLDDHIKKEEEVSSETFTKEKESPKATTPDDHVGREEKQSPKTAAPDDHIREERTMSPKAATPDNDVTADKPASPKSSSLDDHIKKEEEVFPETFTEEKVSPKAATPDDHIGKEEKESPKTAALGDHVSKEETMSPKAATPDDDIVKDKIISPKASTLDDDIKQEDNIYSKPEDTAISKEDIPSEIVKVDDDKISEKYEPAGTTIPHDDHVETKDFPPEKSESEDLHFNEDVSADTTELPSGNGNGKNGHPEVSEPTDRDFSKEESSSETMKADDQLTSRKDVPSEILKSDDIPPEIIKTDDHDTSKEDVPTETLKTDDHDIKKDVPSELLKPNDYYIKTEDASSEISKPDQPFHKAISSPERTEPDDHSISRKDDPSELAKSVDDYSSKDDVHLKSSTSKDHDINVDVSQDVPKTEDHHISKELGSVETTKLDDHHTSPTHISSEITKADDGHITEKGEHPISRHLSPETFESDSHDDSKKDTAFHDLSKSDSQPIKTDDHQSVKETISSPETSKTDSSVLAKPDILPEAQKTDDDHITDEMDDLMKKSEKDDLHPTDSKHGTELLTALPQKESDHVQSPSTTDIVLTQVPKQSENGTAKRLSPTSSDDDKDQETIQIPKIEEPSHSDEDTKPSEQAPEALDIKNKLEIEEAKKPDTKDEIIPEKVEKTEQDSASEELAHTIVPQLTGKETGTDKLDENEDKEGSKSSNQESMEQKHSEETVDDTSIATAQNVEDIESPKEFFPHKTEIPPSEILHGTTDTEAPNNATTSTLTENNNSDSNQDSQATTKDDNSQGLQPSQAPTPTPDMTTQEDNVTDVTALETNDSMQPSQPEKQSKAESGQSDLMESSTITDKQDQSVNEDKYETSKPITKQDGDVNPDDLNQQNLTEEKLLNLEEQLTKENETEETLGTQYANVSIPLFTNVIDTVDDSDDSDSSSDISRKTTLTTRPYQTPRHRPQTSPDKESSDTTERTDPKNVDSDEEAILTIELMDTKVSESSMDESDKTTEDINVENLPITNLLRTIEGEDSIKLYKKDPAVPSVGILPGREKVDPDVDVENTTKQKSVESKPTSTSRKQLENTKLSSRSKKTGTADVKTKSPLVSEDSKLESKTTERKAKPAGKVKSSLWKKKKSSPNETAEEKTTQSDDQTRHSRYRHPKHLTSDQPTQKHSDDRKQSRKSDDEHHRRSSVSKLRVEKDKKSSGSSDKSTTPPKTGETSASKTQPKYMAWYKKKREEMERKRAELKAADDEDQLPKWLKRSMKSQKADKDDRKKSDPKTAEITPRTKRKIKPLINVESEQLKAIVRQGRKLRKAEGGSNEDPPVQIFATTPPATQGPDPKHHLVQHSEYKYEKVPPPFYLHPPPAPHPSPQLSPEHYEAPPTMECGHPEEHLDSGISVSLQGGNRLRHQQLLEKKSVFDIAYSEAAPSQLRSDSTTPPS